MIQLIGIIATVMLAISSIPQIIQCYENGNANGINAGMLWLWFLGLLLMFIFVLFTASNNAILIINYFTNTILVSLILKYKYFPRSTTKSIKAIELIKGYFKNLSIIKYK